MFKLFSHLFHDEEKQSNASAFAALGKDNLRNIYNFLNPADQASFKATCHYINEADSKVCVYFAMQRLKFYLPFSPKNGASTSKFIYFKNNINDLIKAETSKSYLNKALFLNEEKAFAWQKNIWQLRHKDYFDQYELGIIQFYVPIKAIVLYDQNSITIDPKHIVSLKDIAKITVYYPEQWSEQNPAYSSVQNNSYCTLV